LAADVISYANANLQLRRQMAINKKAKSEFGLNLISNPESLSA
jgi:hypothetical protein